MYQINLQNKARAKKGFAEIYWFENEFTGLQKTLFHRIIIPLTAFDSGLDYESQPVKTEIAIEWLALNLDNPSDLHGLVISNQTYPQLEASVYIGTAHNWCTVMQMTINRKKNNIYLIEGQLVIDFETEGIAKNEDFYFKTTFEFRENIT